MMISYDLMQSTRRCLPRTHGLGVRLPFSSKLVCVPTPRAPARPLTVELAVIHDFQMALYGESDVSTRKKEARGRKCTRVTMKEEDIGAAPVVLRSFSPPNISLPSPLYSLCVAVSLVCQNITNSCVAFSA